MKIIMDISISYQSPSTSTGRTLYAILSKEIETTMIPTSEMEIEDSAWKEPKKIKRLTANFQEGYYHLHFGSYTCDKDFCDKEVKMYEGHNWKPVFHPHK